MYIYFCIVSLLVCRFSSYKITIVYYYTIEDVRRLVRALLVLSLYAQHANTANLHLVERPCIVDFSIME